MKKAIYLLVVLAFSLSVSAQSSRAAGFTYYTNYSAFTNALAGQSSYTETFAGLPDPVSRVGTNSYAFSGGAFSFTALIPSTNPPDTSFWVESYDGYKAVSTGLAAEEINLTNISPNTFALGAFFYPTDGVVKTNSTLSISVLFSDLTSTLITTNRASSSVTDWFFGWVTDAPGTSIKSVVVHDPTDSAFTSASQIVLAVPEPSTYALLLMGAGTALWVAKRRKR